MIILAHGGAGLKRPSKSALKAIGRSLEAGYSVLKRGASAVDAVTETIAFMEDSALFNAGEGGNLQLDGIRRLDSSLMEGRLLKAGAVIGLEGYRNPVRVARAAMELPNNVFTNVGAAKLAKKERVARLAPPGEEALKRLKKAESGNITAGLYKVYFGTVGAVAIDGEGNLAAGSSTGGVFAMLPGRVGDTPIIGAGVYADNTLGAVTCTGKGEYILRLCLAKEACMRMERRSAKKAVEAALKRLRRIGGEAGLLALDRRGRYAIAHTTRYMPAGIADKNGVRVSEKAPALPL